MAAGSNEDATVICRDSSSNTAPVCPADSQTSTFTVRLAATAANTPCSQNSDYADFVINCIPPPVSTSSGSTQGDGTICADATVASGAVMYKSSNALAAPSVYSAVPKDANGNTITAGGSITCAMQLSQGESVHACSGLYVECGLYEPSNLLGYDGNVRVDERCWCSS